MMIKYSEIKDVFSPLGINVEEFSIKDVDEIEPYYLVYFKGNTSPYYADGINYINFVQVRAILDVDDIEHQVVKKLDEILNDNGISFDKDYNYIPDERLFELTYEFEVFDG